MPDTSINKSPKNKEVTKRKLIVATGEIIKTEGFANLKISVIARKAQVDRKLIYRYFGGLNLLIEAYVTEHDYWLSFADKIKERSSLCDSHNGRQLFITVLQDQLKYLSAEKDMQHLLLLELSANNPLLRSFHNVRESLLQRLLEITDGHFKHTDVNFRAVLAIITGGINFILLHTLHNGNKFADMDVLSEDGELELLKAIDQIINWAYKSAELQRTAK